MEKERLQYLAEAYFQAFEKKDLSALELMFDDKIILFDPVVKEVSGLSKVLQVNKNIFKNSLMINITKKRIFVDHFSDTCIGELEIYFDKNQINVVDVIEFNTDEKIFKITAYLDPHQ